MQMINLSEKEDFAKHWKKLTHPFCIPAAEVECIEVEDREESERCYRVLNYSLKVRNTATTVNTLAEAVWEHCQDATMLAITHKTLIGS